MSEKGYVSLLLLVSIGCFFMSYQYGIRSKLKPALLWLLAAVGILFVTLAGMDQLHML